MSLVDVDEFPSMDIRPSPRDLVKSASANRYDAPWNQNDGVPAGGLKKTPPSPLPTPLSMPLVPVCL